MAPRLDWIVGSGRFAEPLRGELRRAAPVVFEEGLRGSYILREQHDHTHNPTRGAVAVTHDRLVVWARRRKTIDVPLERTWFGGLGVVADRPDRIRFTIDLGHYTPGRRGVLEVRLRTERANRIAALLERVQR